MGARDQWTKDLIARLYEQGNEFLKRVQKND